MCVVQIHILSKIEKNQIKPVLFIRSSSLEEESALKVGIFDVFFV